MTDLARRPLVLYHGSCYDGFTAAWAFRKFHGPNCDFVPCNYGDKELPDTKGRRVWVLDFSFPREEMIHKIIKPSIKTTVYDHHKTAEAALEGIPAELHALGAQRADKIVFDMNRSGAGITWDELEHAAGVKAGIHRPRHNGERPCRLVDYIEDRDLWNWKLPNSKFVSAYISTLEMSFEVWDALGEKMSTAEGVKEVVGLGSAVQGYIDSFGDKACKHASTRKVGGFEVQVINVPYMNCSDHIGKLAEMNPDDPFAAGFFLRGDGLWQFGLRSRGDFDVSEVAKQYGGGGHAGAAGFQVEYLPWEGSDAEEGDSDGE